ncbi:hypothetical protein [Nocardia abscessus]|uniref:hypothetical protein n=1 Tax=Nocardia abscessus TaxID=120957 RepID=UPI0002EB96B6|nr:hypothetical protein [Nocardia abscessus]MCC3328307.1 hypothetical protein [Nocardia abscessus]
MQRPLTVLRHLTRALRRAFTPHRRGITVRVFLNTNPRATLHGYTRAAVLDLAYDHTVPTEDAADDDALLERAFAAFNGYPDRPEDRVHADAWTDNRFRSLSVGDVVALDDRYYACQSRGWVRIPAPRT